MSELPDGAIPHFNTQTMTPADAAKRLECPLARVMHKPGDGGMCKGPRCAVWRFLPMLTTDDTFKGAVKREIEAIHAETGRSKDLCHKDAVARVAADPSAYCIPSHHERGYCGFGGRP